MKKKQSSFQKRLKRPGERSEQAPLPFERYARKLKVQQDSLNVIFQCPGCGLKTTREDAAYCPICGNNALVRGRATEMLYKKIKLNENGKALVCPHCNNEEVTPGDYCVICGNEIVNRCADMADGEVDRLVTKGCRTILPGNARFCYRCGNESTFYQKGWLRDWRSENTKKAIENINVTLDFDELRSSRSSV